jgi:hypothetical protein
VIDRALSQGAEQGPSSHHSSSQSGEKGDQNVEQFQARLIILYYKKLIFVVVFKIGGIFYSGKHAISALPIESNMHYTEHAFTW